MSQMSRLTLDLSAKVAHIGFQLILNIFSSETTRPVELLFHMKTSKLLYKWFLSHNKIAALSI